MRGGDERRRRGNRAGHCEQPAVHGAAANPQLGAATNFVHFYTQTSANSIFVHILCMASMFGVKLLMILCTSGSFVILTSFR